MNELSRHMVEHPDDKLNAQAVRTPPGMAYLIGTGPVRANCGGCKHFMGKVRRSGIGKGELQEGRCREYIRMMRSKGIVAPVYKLDPKTPACRHWEKKPEPKKHTND